MTSSWKSFRVLAVIAALQLGAAPLARAALYSTNSYGDAFVATGPSSGLVNNNYGGGGALSVASSALANGEFQSVLRFDLAGARNSFDAQFGPSGWTIQSISLRLAAASPNNSIFNASGAGQFGVSLMQNGSWVEGTGTPGSPGATGLTYSGLGGFIGGGDENLGTFSFAGGTSGANVYTLTLTPGLLGDVFSGDTLSLRHFAADTTLSYLFNSREFGMAGNRPLLTIDAIPEPQAPALLVMAFVILVCARYCAPKCS